METPEPIDPIDPNSVYTLVCSTCGFPTLVREENTSPLTTENANIYLDMVTSQRFQEVTEERDKCLSLLRALTFAYITENGKLRMIAQPPNKLPVYWQQAVDFLNPSTQNDRSL